MTTDEQAPASPGEEGARDAEGRALLLRLLRLVAAEVAARLRRQASGEPPNPGDDNP
jgi:hypothetical protein